VIPELPPSWQRRLDGYEAEAQTIGMSDARVFRLTAPGRTPLFVKTETMGPLSELPGEIARLRWLGAQRVPCPAVLESIESGGRRWLLMAALAGRDLASSPNLSTDAIIRLSAEALVQLHALDWRKCPFDQRIAGRVVAARTRLDAGLVDEDDFDEPGRSAQQAYGELLATIPPAEDLVVAHGDACFPNFVAEAGRFTGFVDCGRLGVADRWQDLALVTRSLDFNFGAGGAGAFLAAYGARLDPEKQAWYRLLDEFF
jgi:aminoglycoside 3'-phosphotransferase II